MEETLFEEDGSLDPEGSEEEVTEPVEEKVQKLSEEEIFYEKDKTEKIKFLYDKTTELQNMIQVLENRFARFRKVMKNK